MVEPSAEFPIRRYLPKMKEKVMLEEIDLREKPGFTQQAKAFVDFIEGKASPVAATLEEARFVVSTCEAIIGTQYPAKKAVASR